jgi:hypothetical protein
MHDMWIAILLAAVGTAAGQETAPDAGVAPDSEPNTEDWGPDTPVVPPRFVDKEHPTPKWAREVVWGPWNIRVDKIGQLDVQDLLELAVVLRLEAYPPDMRASTLLAERFGKSIFPIIARTLEREPSDRFADGLLDVTAYICRRLDAGPGK